MDSLVESQRAIVVQELERHLTWTAIFEDRRTVRPRYRASRITFRDDWNLPSSETEEFVFCHNDLSQKNVIVDPCSLKVAATIDWEYAGFHPDFFEHLFLE
ncbi:hypothetical protein K469DRAFT_717974 [Zopfia rhizophila CBS 207.26]|uniref:Aminoglycoside phosphotransferase domain-containing protein n=1 Tax=Zopfia rhizophila CBS 207.26 TaxID=1314779 RepID=A0A6A6DM84_9PEZI|nr:hypothetical protein K469DRAFT_717974 [Zopfia rhizophila CBS 207.26]